jgi:hypothetical protein
MCILQECGKSPSSHVQGGCRNTEPRAVRYYKCVKLNQECRKLRMVAFVGATGRVLVCAASSWRIDSVWRGANHSWAFWELLVLRDLVVLLKES